MDGIGFVFIDAVGVIFSIIVILVMCALCGWFGFAVGGALGASVDAEDSGGFLGMLIGVAIFIALLFSFYR